MPDGARTPNTGRRNGCPSSISALPVHDENSLALRGDSADMADSSLQCELHPVCHFSFDSKSVYSRKNVEQTRTSESITQPQQSLTPSKRSPSPGEEIKPPNRQQHHLLFSRPRTQQPTAESRVEPTSPRNVSTSSRRRLILTRPECGLASLMFHPRSEQQTIVLRNDSPR
ncbi:hypothetical protein BO82DRAFT_158800 [Aspergillus uvarum CBS 121591]|uniref:Uncharacterized protein n=1 Tax=Aspergillus uvarum CBS 121591 TaxID=1448315 RepID=A0A319BZK3_9EURO|nr:hypothetical protein BO82DRAFT_158800 [Aspergillus uvarum CBS 121591]PYH78205.1 hypothetical protein BO82DRAFT_158800 [Aspergillus uvarum CBS 121591]